MRTNSYIKQLLNKMIFTLIIILFSPQVSFCWNVTKYDDYVRAEAEYNDGYKFTLELPINGLNSDEKPYWKIKATSDLQKWIELANMSGLEYELFIDGNPAEAVYSPTLIYDNVNNVALVVGYLSEPLLEAIQRGNSLSIRYKKNVLETNSYFKENVLETNSFSLISLNLAGSSSAIEDLKNTTEKSIKDKRNREYAYIGIASLVGFLVALQILAWLFRKTKTIAKKVTNTSQEISVIVKNKVEVARRNRLYNKIEESVLDEMVREAVRQAIREGVKPDVIKLCTICLGEGCDQCGNKGWTV